MSSYYTLPYVSNPTDAGPSRISDNNMSPPSTRKRLKGLRPWSFTGKPKADGSIQNGKKKETAPEVSDVLGPYEELRISDGKPRSPIPPRFTNAIIEEPNEIHGMEEGDDGGSDEEPDAYSWVDPSIAGTERLRATVSRYEPCHSPFPCHFRFLDSCTDIIVLCSRRGRCRDRNRLVRELRP